MKSTIFLAATFLFAGISFAQSKMEKCDKLTQKEQNVCKQNVLTELIAEQVVYPEKSVKNLDEGTVYVRFTTDQNQNVKTVRVLDENVNSELAQAAREAVAKFSKSENADLLAVNEVYRIPVRFELK